MSPLNRSAYDLAPAEWSALCADWDVPAFRAKQIRQWLYARLAATFDEMANLPLLLRAPRGRQGAAGRYLQSAGVERRQGR